VGSIISVKESRGIINRINNGHAWVSLVDNCSSEGSTCHAEGGGCGACGGKKSGRTVRASLDSDMSVTPGMLITVRYTEINELLGALIVFGIPLGSALFSLFLWYIIAPGRAESGLSILSSGAAFAAGFIPVRIIDGIFRRRYPSRIIPPLPQR